MKGFLIFDEQEGRFIESKTKYDRLQRWGDDEILTFVSEKSSGSFSILSKSQFPTQWTEKPLFSHPSLYNLMGKMYSLQIEKPVILLGVNVGNDYEISTYKVHSAGFQLLPKLRFPQLTYVSSTQMLLRGDRLYVSQPYNTSDQAFRWTGMLEEFSLDLAGNQLQKISRFEPGIFSRTEATLGHSLAASGDYIFAATQSYKAPIEEHIKNPAEIFVLKPQ